MASSTQAGAIDLEKELTCSICTDVLYQPLTLLDCLHTFCGSCSKEWFSWQATSANHSSRGASPYTCPSCRAIVRAARPNANITTLLDMFLQANPGKGKTEAEKAEMRAHYRPGDDVLPPPRTEPESDDSEDERLMEDVMQMSVADLNPGVEANRRALRTHRHREHDRDRRRRDIAEARRRQDAVSRDVTHQPSLRSLLSASELDPTAVQEVYDQIIASAAFEGVDTDNLTPAQEEALIGRIAEAFRRQHRPGNREDRTIRAADRTGQTRSRDQASRPHLSEQWDQIAHHNDGRSTERSRESPNALSQASFVPLSTRTTSDPLIRPEEVEDHRRRAASARSNTMTVTTPAATNDTGPRPRRADTSIQPSPSPRIGEPSSLQAQAILRHDEQHHTPATGTAQRSQSETLPYPTTDQSPLAQTSASSSRHQQSLMATTAPSIHCQRCNKPDIQYHLHYVCKICDQGTYALCQSCYRIGKGCKHWYGFGYAAEGRWRRSTPEEGTERPHILSPRRFTTTSPPQMLGGAFCEICSEHADRDTYWHCTICLDGAWGYCSSCVQQEKHCTHPLTPVTRAKDDDDRRKLSTGALRPIPLPHLDESAYYFSLPNINCVVCSAYIPANHTRLHCSQCRHCDYNICNDSYYAMEAAGKISSTDGLRGLRKCLQGHPMSIVVYRDLTDKIQQRVIVSEAIGGYDAKHGSAKATPTSNLACLALWSWWPAEGVEDELAFPRNAELREVEKINTDYYLGVYAGSRGLFPANHVRLL